MLRVFEKVLNGAQASAAPDGKGRIFDAAATAAGDYSQACDTGRPGLVLRLRHALFDRLVFRALRTAMGGRLEYSVSGGAPLGERLGHFFRGVGVTILKGYGPTETTAATTVNRPSRIKMGTVGPPLPGTAVRIAEAAEIEAIYAERCRHTPTLFGATAPLIWSRHWNGDRHDAADQ